MSNKRHHLQKGVQKRVKICLSVHPETAKNLRKCASMLGYSNGEAYDRMVRSMMIGRYHIGVSRYKYPTEAERKAAMLAWVTWRNASNADARERHKAKKAAEKAADAEKFTVPTGDPAKPKFKVPTKVEKIPTKFST